ncbi:MAG: BlaI/MecI/CopY family transcriptional regulator [Lachnospiraceae bacterium]|nr:BlaI/MecI/CopY family transcriptional regulator [Lachnospiraceae bacterium]
MNITDSEQKILSILWEEGSLSTMEIYKKLEGETNWSKQAVISFLRRMETKGIVKYVEKGRAKLYSATITKDVVAKKQRGFLLNTFYQGKIGLMISEMVSEKSLSDGELKELHEILDNLYKEGKE